RLFWDTSKRGVNLLSSLAESGTITVSMNEEQVAWKKLKSRLDPPLQTSRRIWQTPQIGPLRSEHRVRVLPQAPEQNRDECTV
ncbi:MAG TPA: hypothetical protein VHM02_10765, partial [Thermoanaerobaculia bacterium]|nr:hypothetical protein [Thermoanaerobaculia bacterium]